MTFAHSTLEACEALYEQRVLVDMIQLFADRTGSSSEDIIASMRSIAESPFAMKANQLGHWRNRRNFMNRREYRILRNLVFHERFLKHVPEVSERMEESKHSVEVGRKLSNSLGITCQHPSSLKRLEGVYVVRSTEAKGLMLAHEVPGFPFCISQMHITLTDAIKFSGFIFEATNDEHRSVLWDQVERTEHDSYISVHVCRRTNGVSRMTMRSPFDNGENLFLNRMEVAAIAKGKGEEFRDLRERLFELDSVKWRVLTK